MKKWLFILMAAALCCAQAGMPRFAPKATSPRKYVTDEKNAVHPPQCYHHLCSGQHM